MRPALNTPREKLNLCIRPSIEQQKRLGLCPVGSVNAITVFNASVCKGILAFLVIQREPFFFGNAADDVRIIEIGLTTSRHAKINTLPNHDPTRIVEQVLWQLRLEPSKFHDRGWSHWGLEGIREYTPYGLDRDHIPLFPTHHQ